MKFHNIDQNSEEWFKLRCGKVTASQFKIAYSGKSTKGYKGLIYTKRAEIRTCEYEDTFKSEWMERGSELEAIAVNEYESYTFTETSNGGFFEYNDYIGASPDRCIGDNGLLEIKCPKASTMERYIDENRLPPEYFHQVHGQLLCSGRDYVEFVAYHPKYELFIKRINKDENILKEMEQKLIEFVNQIKLK